MPGNGQPRPDPRRASPTSIELPDGLTKSGGHDGGLGEEDWCEEDWCEDRWLTAIHESGHAVAMLGLGDPFRYITLRPRGSGTAGRVQVVDRPTTPTRARIASAAGPMAEAYARCHVVSGRLPSAIPELDEDSSVWVHFDDFRADVGAGDDLGYECDDCAGFALGVVTHPTGWRLLSMIASALLDHGRIDYRDCRAMAQELHWWRAIRAQADTLSH